MIPSFLFGFFHNINNNNEKSSTRQRRRAGFFLLLLSTSTRSCCCRGSTGQAASCWAHEEVNTIIIMVATGWVMRVLDGTYPRREQGPPRKNTLDDNPRCSTRLPRKSIRLAFLFYFTLLQARMGLHFTQRRQLIYLRTNTCTVSIIF